MHKYLKEVVRNIKYEVLVVKREIRSLLKDNKDYLSQPSNEFTTQGYEIIPNFLAQDECDRLIDVTNHYLRAQSYLIRENAYLVCRKEIRDVDMNVQQIMNAQEIDSKLSRLFDSRIIEGMFEERIGEKMRLQSITIQVDDIDTQSKRGFHSDGVTPPVYKAFVYLNDVDDYGDGPYTLIPGSHRHTIRKIINYLCVWLINLVFKKKTFSRKKDDRRLFYRDRHSVSIFGKAGTLIISNQQLAHKGWQKHDRKKRYALICFLIAEKYYRGQSFNLNQAAILEKV